MPDRIKQGKPESSYDDHLDENFSCEESFFETTINCDPLANPSEVINNLHYIAEKLGVENTRSHLIPFLVNLISAVELSELKDLAIILGDFECYVGGPKYAHILLLPLEELASVKLDDVRMAAIKSLQALAGIMEISDLETYFMPLIANMTMNDKCTKRWSVSYLFTSIYMRVSPQFQGHILDYYCFLCFDTLTSVRQDAAKCLVDLSEVVHLSVFDTKLIPQLEQFSSDQNDCVRTSALITAISISNKLDISFTRKKILPIIFNFVNDTSFEARLVLIKNIAKLLVISVNCIKTTEDMIQLLLVLTKDEQLEVRLQSITVLYDFSVILHKNLATPKANQLMTKFLIPALCKLIQDSDVKYRLEVPAILAKFGKIVPNEIIENSFLDLVKELLEDKNLDVVFNIIKYMKDILGPWCCTLVSLPEYKLVCCLKAYIINDSWEMRNTGAIYLGIFAVQMGYQFFEKFLKPAFLMLFTDPKSAVQQTALDVFKMLVKEFGMDWAQTYVVPYLNDLSNTKHTYNKMTFLSFAKVCAVIMCTKFRALNIKMKKNSIK